ncbi:coiled-coil domain-containing protein 142-like [Macrosteles quadrilineatus]|uniref:coiled-coil domain-containing protein 142-like n=1 Tax=Macrosteles quadrilineatus TaxID=74068 RepID=UPI0023E24954|nr:coiled-coil domain-containing protein 142-like [Macrosteles quadrilineatus]
MSVMKWKPSKDKATEEFTNNCKLIYGLSTKLRARLGNILKSDPSNWQDLESISKELPHMMTLYHSVLSGPDTSSHVLNFRREFWQAKIWHQRLATLYLINQVVTLVLVHCVEDPTHQNSVITLVTFFNDLLNLNLTSKPRGITVVKNTCPSLLQPLRRLSITKILQILAQGRAEQCGHLLVNVLLDLYLDTNRGVSPADSGDPDTEPLLSDEELPSSDNSSMEIYRTLTRYMTPPQGGESELLYGEPDDTMPLVSSDVAMLDGLLYSEDKRLTPLLTSISVSASSLLGPHAIKQSKQTGDMKVRRRVRHKVLEYYSQVLWGEVGAFLDHVLLWWGSRPLGTQTCHHFRSWLHTFMQTVTLPDMMRPALHSLQDSLCCHVTSTSWDQLFRRALVAASTQHSRHIVHNVEQGTYTGKLFSELFSDLMLLSNSCEGPNWTVQDLEELPVVEQIPVLHRLDHSIHTVRLWVQSRAKQLSNPWNMDQFFRVTQSDINTCLRDLSQLKFSNQVDILNAECSVHVVVCVKMRAKLVSEVKANLEKLQNMSTVVLDILASVCRTVSLANLHMMFPDPHYWRQRLDEMPQFASNYVEDYLEEVLRPVLSATTHLPLSVQQRVSGMVLNIMCEAWLDHIYAHQIKFSEWGALQLLTDFGAVPTWLLERVSLSGELRKHLLNTEVLRRCEGVGRLLLRRPGERIPMTIAPSRKKHDSDDSPARTPELMPAEMYVPNQEQWLQLRAPRKGRALTLCCTHLLTA